MTKEEAIKYLKQIYPNGGCSWLDEQRIGAIRMAIDALSQSVTKISDQEESASKNYRERYKHIAYSGQFKKTHKGMSIGEVIPVECEEPVSEGLGDYINELSKQFPEVFFAKLSRIAVRVAKWQKQQMMKDAVVMEAHEEYGELWGDITKCSTEKGKKYKVIILKMEGLL